MPVTDWPGWGGRRAGRTPNGRRCRRSWPRTSSTQAAPSTSPGRNAHPRSCQWPAATRWGQGQVDRLAFFTRSRRSLH